MSTPIGTREGIMSATITEDAFTLDVHVITDVVSGGDAVPCGTNDGCAPTCASSCTSNAS